MNETRSHAGHSALWAALLVGGQAATVSLVRAGPQVGNQHLPPAAELLAAAPLWALALVAVQALLVGWRAWHGRGAVRAALRSLRPIQAGALLFALVVSSAALSRDPATYAQELLVTSLLELLQLATVILFAIDLPAAGAERIGGVLDRLLGPKGGEVVAPAKAGLWVWAVALAVAAASAILALFAYQSHPHVPDEVAYLLQARTFASARLALPEPPVPVAFDTYLMWARDGRWFSVFPPAWPALLALGVVAGAPWIVNPLLGGFNVLLVFALLREICPLRTARLATLLFAASPWHLFLAMSLMAHISALTVTLAGAIAVARLRRAPSALGWALLGGASAGLLLLFRPLEAVIVGAVLGLWSLGAHGPRWRFAPTALLTLAVVASAALTVPYNRQLLGSGTVFPVMAYMDATFGPGSNALGFGANRGAGWTGADPLPGHGPLDVAINAGLNLAAINVDLFGWATGSLVALFFALFAGRPRRIDRQMLLVIVLVVGLHSLYWFSGGPDFGARYWFLTVVPCAYLTARGLESIAERAGEALPQSLERVLSATALLACAGLGIFVPWRAVDKYHDYRGMRPELRELAARLPWRDALVLVSGRRHPDFASAVVYNPLDLDAAAPVFVWDRGGVRDRLVQSFPARRYWLVDGPTVTGDGYRVVAGPLGADELLDLPERSAVR